MLLSPAIFWYLIRIVAVPLGVLAEVLIGTASSIITATIAVAVYRQVTRDVPDARRAEPEADAMITDGFGALQPGEMVSIALVDPGFEPISGQVLSADDGGLTIFEPPADPSQSGYFEEIPADRIATITRHGSAPLTRTIADAFTGDSEPPTRPWAPWPSLLRTVRASPNRTAIGFGLGAGLLVLLPQAAIWSVFGLATLFLLPILTIGFGLLAGLAIPGWRGLGGLSIGLISAASFFNFIRAISQPDLYYPSVTSAIAEYIVEDAINLIVLASGGFAIGVIVRRAVSSRGRRPDSS